MSIVIPALQEAANIEQVVTPLLQLPNVEVIVADGGSTDGTIDLAHRLGVRVVSSRAGRGRQMNAGAALTQGEAILFLHADTRLPEGFQTQVWSTLSSGAGAGAFRLSIDGQERGLRWVEWGANWRSRSLQLPYGDQGIFVRSELFHRLGGFRNWPLMEDYELCRRLRRCGKVALASTAVTTSARRWLRLGICRATLVNQLCLVGFRLGISPETLARWYSSRG